MLSPTPQQHFSTLSLTPFQPEEEFLLVLIEVQSRAAQDPSEKRSTEGLVWIRVWVVF